MRRSHRLEHLVDRVYQAMLDTAVWPTFLAELATALDGVLPMFFLHSERALASVILAVDYDPEYVDAFPRHYRHNVWLQGAARKRLLTEGSVRTSHMTCSRRELLRSEWYGLWCRPLGITQAIGSTILKSSTSMFNISLMRDGRRDFGDDEIALFEALMPHLQRALKVHILLTESEESHRDLLELLDGLSVGLALVSGSGRVLYMNKAAERFLMAKDGLDVDASGLKAVSAHETAKLRALIGAAAETSAGRSLHPGGAMRITRPNGRRPLEVLVAPVRRENLPPVWAQPAVLLYVSDPDAALAVPDSTLSELYGLTAAEARVAALAASGAAVQQIARALGVSRNTVKTQLKNVFAKTGTARQAELVSLLLGGVAHVHAPSGKRRADPQLLAKSFMSSSTTLGPAAATRLGLPKLAAAVPDKGR